MDLKDVIDKVNEQAMEAHNAFHAGHNDQAEVRLGRIWWLIEDELPNSRRPETDVTESLTSEKPAAPSMETPAEVPGAPVQPAVIDPAAAAQKPWGSLTDEKPIQ